MKRKLWGGRFSKRTDPLVERFTSSIAVDFRLARYDVIGSIAHARMLGRCRIIPMTDSRRIVQGLQRILRQIDQGRFRPDPAAEDVHTQVQQALERRIGSSARMLHTARSRNDQVSLDLRLYCRDAAARIAAGVAAAQRALVDLALKYERVVIPGYTHLQQAQPVLLAHQLLAYVEMLARDAERLQDARKRIEVLPLGAGALAGTSLPIDRAFVARQLGFSRVAANSMDAVADRDFAVELLEVLAGIGVHLSRLSEDLVLWTSREFGIASLDDAFATGSSLMPQKKNPDVLELIRGQAGLLIGDVTALLTVMKGLPMSYNRDLQWDKTCVFRAVDAVAGSLTVLERLLRRLTIHPEQARRLLGSDALCATDLAEYLVRRGVPFGEAHQQVGRMVAAAQEAGRQLSALGLAQLQRLAPAIRRDALSVLDPWRSVQRKRSAGSTNPALVQRELRRWKNRLTP